MKPTIGKTEAGKDLAIDVQKLLATRMLLDAESGGGKTVALKRLLEQTHGHVQQIVIDPEGDFSTLREKFDYLLCAPEGADAVANPKTAAILARKLRETRVSAVIDIYDLRPSEQRLFVRLFVEELLAAPKNLWNPCLVVIDEAQIFCLDEETEVFGKNGWTRWSNLREGQQVVCFDTSTGAYEYGAVRRIITRQHDGPMVRLQSDGIDCLATDDHRVVLRRIQRAQGRYRLYDWTFCPASDVPHHVYIPIGGAPEGTGIDGLSPEMARLIGWVITDGCYTGRSSACRYLCISQSHVTTKQGRNMAAELQALAAGLGEVSIYERPARSYANATFGRVITSSPSIDIYLGVKLSEKLLAYLGQDIHRIPRLFLENANRQQLKALFDGLMEGDGTATHNGWVTFYAGKNEGLADDFQELATRLGISTTKRLVPQNGQWAVSITRRSQHYIRKPERENYKGLVWDITVPTGAFVARRRGKVFVTGNCPEQGESESHGAIMDLRGRGRKRGLCLVLSTPRLAQLSKDACAGLQNKLIGVTTLDLDVKRAARDLSMSPTEATILLRNLEPGEFYVFGPALTRAITKIKVGSIQTLHGQHVVGKDNRPPAPSEKIKDVIAKLTDLPKEAEQEARTVSDYKRENTNLKRELTLAKKEQPKQTTTEIKRIEVPVVGMKAIKGIIQADADMRKTLGKMRIVQEAVQNGLTGYQQSIEKLLIEFRKVRDAQAPQMQLGQIYIPAPIKIVPIQRPVNSVYASGNGQDVSLTPMDRAILTVLAQFAEGCRANKLVLLAGYTLNGSTRNSFSKLRTLGFIVGSNTDVLRITQEGLDALGEYEPLPIEGDGLRSYWLNHRRLTPMDRSILGTVINNPDGMEAEPLAVAAGYTLNGSTRNSFSKLRTAGLIVGKNTEVIKAVPELLQ